MIYLALGRFDEAFADLDKSISMGMNSPGTHLGRGRCYEKKGNNDAAVAGYRKAMEQTAKDDYEKSAQAKARERLSALGVPLTPNNEKRE
jgi:Tfp pilus assembly protein PilF